MAAAGTGSSPLRRMAMVALLNPQRVDVERCSPVPNKNTGNVLISKGRHHLAVKLLRGSPRRQLQRFGDACSDVPLGFPPPLLARKGSVGSLWRTSGSRKFATRRARHPSGSATTRPQPPR